MSGVSLTLPAWFADRLDVDMHECALFCPLLTTVERCHQDAVLPLTVVTQLLRVPDIS